MQQILSSALNKTPAVAAGRTQAEAARIDQFQPATGGMVGTVRGRATMHRMLQPLN